MPSVHVDTNNSKTEPTCFRAETSNWNPYLEPQPGAQYIKLLCAIPQLPWPKGGQSSTPISSDLPKTHTQTSTTSLRIVIHLTMMKYSLVEINLL